MSFSPISFISPNFRDFKNEWLKAYEPGTTTPKVMALESNGGTQVAKLQLNVDGFIVSAGAALVIPYIDGAYDLWLFPTEAEADANDTTNAERLADDITGVSKASLTSDIINDLSQPHDFATLQDYIDSPIEFPDGKIITTKVRSVGNFGGASYTKITGTGTANPYDIIASATVNQSIVLNEESNTIRYASQWGSISNIDSSLAWQAMIDSLPLGTGTGTLSGGRIRFAGTPIVGGLIVPTNMQNVLIEGDSLVSEIIVKTGTIGIWFQDHFCGLMHCTVKSQGTSGDLQNTRGVLFESTPSPAVSGFNYLEQVNMRGFSGYGLQSTDSINFSWTKGYIVDCVVGLSFPDDTISFGTTLTIKELYISGGANCTAGISAVRLFRSHFQDLTIESCDRGLDLDRCALTIGHRCYFEKNRIVGARLTDCEIQDLTTYKNDPTGVDKFEYVWTGASATSDRGYLEMDRQKMIMKNLGLLTLFGVDPVEFASMGLSNNIGVKYGENTIPLIRGVNLFDDSAWVNVRFAEFKGWSALNEGFEVSGVTAGDNTYGIQQTVTLDSTKTYVLDIDLETVQGAAISTLRFDAQVVTSGVPFVPDTNGANLFKAFGIEGAAVTIENYIKSITVAEVVQDNNQIAQAAARLTTLRPTRGDVYMASIPTTGVWSQGETVKNSAPVKDASNMVLTGWICTVTGNAGTFVFEPQYVSAVSPAV